MNWFEDVRKQKIRLSDERKEHFEEDHPEMSGQIDRIGETLSDPDIIVKSKTDLEVELFYRGYEVTPVTKKYLCVVVKVIVGDWFIITAYFTDTIKRGEMLWERK